MSSPVTAPVPKAKFVPPHKREGYKGSGATMAGYVSPRENTEQQLVKLGFTKEAGGQLYFPGTPHPHVHVGLAPGKSFMSWSSGKQHLGISAKSMYREKTMQKSYEGCIAEIEETYPDANAKQNLAAALECLKLYDQNSSEGKEGKEKE